MAGAADGDGMATEEGAIMAKVWLLRKKRSVYNSSTWQVQPTTNAWLLRKEQSVHNLQT